MSGRGRMRLKRMRDGDEFDYPPSQQSNTQPRRPQPISQSNNRSRRSQENDDDDDDDEEHELIIPTNQSHGQSSNQSGDQEGELTDDDGNLSSDESMSASQELNPMVLSPTISQFIKPVTARVQVEHQQRVAANSDQSTETRRAIGSVYKQLQDATRSDMDIIDNNEGISRGLQLANELNRRTAHVTEELQDAEELSVLTEKGISKARKKLSHGPLIDYKMYCLFFFRKYARPADTNSEGAEHNEIDWTSAGFDAKKFGGPPPLGGATVTSFDLFGVQPVKQRSLTVRREKDELKHSAPAQGSKLTLEASQTDERVKDLTALFKRVTRNGPVPFWEFLVDPFSFVGTVENVFDFSFIVKDHCRMTWKEQDLDHLFPMIQYKESKVAEGTQASQSQATQATNASQPSNPVRRSKREASAADRVAHCTVTLDYERWRGLIEAFDIKQPMIPSRYGGRKPRPSNQSIRQSMSVSSNQSNKPRPSQQDDEEDDENVAEQPEEEDNVVENDEEDDD